MSVASVEPLVDFESLCKVDITRELHKAKLTKAGSRGCKLSVQRKNGALSLRKTEKAVPKTLVCHDFKGGYLEDKYLDGASGLDHQPYTFLHWSKIDTFVYFSHKFITIPPLGWIEAAHKNGVQILGTIITEFDDGAKICKDILKSDENMHAFVEKCARIAEHVGFDGYLLNIENSIQPECIPSLIGIAKALTERMHKANPDSLVIWYDSVTINGDLKWQNALNDLNAPFFNVCDGIFLNYNWDEEKLASTILYNQERAHDIYVGIDVFGRGCPGGGGFDSNVALSMVRYHGLSAAIFAPAWTHEKAQRLSDFNERDQKFWLKLEPLLYHQGLNVHNNLDLCVNPGCGKDKDNNGTWWLNLSQQSQMPFFNGLQNELFCDLQLDKTGSFEISIHWDAPTEISKVKMNLFFDEKEAILVKDADWTLSGDHKSCTAFICDTKTKSFKCLHCIQVQNVSSSHIERISLTLHHK